MGAQHARRRADSGAAPKLGVDHFAAYIYDDHGKMIGQSEGLISQLAGLHHQFVYAIQPRSGPVEGGVVTIDHPHPPNPTGHDPVTREQLALLAKLAREQLASVIQARP